MKEYFVIAVVAAGVTEWVKNFLPAKVKECGKFLAGLAAIISAFTAFGYVFVNHLVDEANPLSWQSIAKAVVIVMGLSQTSYQLLVQTFKALKTKLTEKITNTTEDEIEKKAQELADKITQ